MPKAIFLVLPARLTWIVVICTAEIIAIKTIIKCLPRSKQLRTPHAAYRQVFYVLLTEYAELHRSYYVMWVFHAGIYLTSTFKQEGTTLAKKDAFCPEGTTMRGRVRHANDMRQGKKKTHSVQRVPRGKKHLA
jgi:hypothetical protein